MSRPQEPHRPFFSFGNPFRILSPKSSQLSPRLLSQLNAFEETLLERLRKLTPKDKDDVLSLAWMKLAMESLSEGHNDVKNLITELELPVSDWDEKWIDVYLDISVKLLDICIVFSSELTRINQGNLLLQCLLHNLESNSPDQFTRARSSLDSWRRHINSKNPRVETCKSILDGLVKSLNLPKVKNSTKGKVLMHAMYGAKVETVYICSVFASAFCGSAKNLVELTIPDSLSWAQAFTNLQTNMNTEIRNIFSQGEFTVLKELDAVNACLEKLYPMLEDELVPVDVESFKSSVSDLRRMTEKLTQGLDLLTKEVDGFFKLVLTGRDALLCNLRAPGTPPDTMLRRNVEGQALS
ncbi:hypothetical protein SLE2022_028780 [Rubroshorea leprosula]